MDFLFLSHTHEAQKAATATTAATTTAEEAAEAPPFENTETDSTDAHHENQSGSAERKNHTNGNGDNHGSHGVGTRPLPEVGIAHRTSVFFHTNGYIDCRLPSGFFLLPRDAAAAATAATGTFPRLFQLLQRHATAEDARARWHRRMYATQSSHSFGLRPTTAATSVADSAGTAPISNASSFSSSSSSSSSSAAVSSSSTSSSSSSSPTSATTATLAMTESPKNLKGSTIANGGGDVVEVEGKAPGQPPAQPMLYAVYLDETEDELVRLKEYVHNRFASLNSQRFQSKVQDLMNLVRERFHCLPNQFWSHVFELEAARRHIGLRIGELRRGLCDEMALLFKVLCDAEGIDCRMVRGQNPGGKDHSWNFVREQERGKWFLIDVVLGAKLVTNSIAACDYVRRRGTDNGCPTDLSFNADVMEDVAVLPPPTEDESEMESSVEPGTPLRAVAEFKEKPEKKRTTPKKKNGMPASSSSSSSRATNGISSLLSPSTLPSPPLLNAPSPSSSSSPTAAAPSSLAPSGRDAVVLLNHRHVVPTCTCPATPLDAGKPPQPLYGSNGWNSSSSATEPAAADSDSVARRYGSNSFLATVMTTDISLADVVAGISSRDTMESGETAATTTTRQDSADRQECECMRTCKVCGGTVPLSPQLLEEHRRHYDEAEDELAAEVSRQPPQRLHIVFRRDEQSNSWKSEGPPQFQFSSTSSSASSSPPSTPTDSFGKSPFGSPLVSRGKTDPNAPRKPPSSFNLFTHDLWKKFKHSDLFSGGSIMFIGRFAGERWKSLSDAERQPYVAKSAKLRQSYSAAMEEYKKSACFEEYQKYLDELRANGKAEQSDLTPHKSSYQGGLKKRSTSGQSSPSPSPSPSPGGLARSASAGVRRPSSDWNAQRDPDTPSAIKRRRSSVIDYDIDDIVPGTILTRAPVTPLVVKEVHVPGWRIKDDDEMETVEQDEESDGEDTSDENYERLHARYEKTEVMAYLQWSQKVHRTRHNSASGSSPGTALGEPASIATSDSPTDA